MTYKRILRSALIFLSIAAAALAFAAAPVPENGYSDLKWRLLGPFRAGWSTCAAGDPSNPNAFYFGAADGGVWKTFDAGRTWQPIFEKQAVASVGALAVASGDANTLYVGTGQVAPRYDIASGNGVYGSRDGGRTWTHLGLEDTRHIGRILVDPRDPNVALVAALGHVFGPNEQRGVFRTTDGGKSWQKVLYKDPDTGAVDLAFDPSAPDIVYASLWQLRRYPWQAYFTAPAGPGSGIYKSIDGGRSWAPVAPRGLPGGHLGRIGLAVGSGTKGMRVYALIDSEGWPGLYRSDNGGDTWRRVNEDASLADWYFGRITPDPHNPDVVYVMGRSVRRSTDGGEHFTITKGAPGGDDYHFLWINPNETERMILASDQGTTVTVDSGRTWSSWYNQPTGQFYHLAADNGFPYRVYSGQQDSGSVSLATFSDYGALTFRDWHPVGADERDYDIPDPANPDIVYGSGLGGRLSRWDGRTGQVQNVSPWPVSSYGARPTTLRYRYTWITPIAISSLAPHSIYQGAQVLFRSDNGGQSWDTISQDLTGAVPGAQECTGNVAVEKATACGYGVIFTIAPSPVARDVIWVGTDNGLIQVSRDGGKSWQNVTPPGISAWSKIAQIDASALDPATAYAAVDRHRLDDYGPHAWRTHDYGGSWTAIEAGLPSSAHVNVVRQDPVQAGLLFAGTSRGAFVSFDDGDHWQSLQLNLPTTGVTDLLIHGNDLVASTLGRAIWSLDDISPLRQLARENLAAQPLLFPPAEALRLRRNENRDTPLPADEPTAPNPPEGAILDYYLDRAPTQPVKLEILDAGGALVRSFGSGDVPVRPPAEQYFADRWLTPPAALPARAGHNRFVWNLRYPRPEAVQYEYSIASVPGNTPVVPEGPLVLPGIYEVRLTVAGRSYTRPLTVRMDPRVNVPQPDLAAQLQFERQIADAMARSAAAHREVTAALARLDDAERRIRSGQDLPQGMDSIQEMRKEVNQFITGDSPDNLLDINSALASLETDVEGVDRAPTAAQREVLETYQARLEKALEHWKQFKQP